MGSEYDPVFGRSQESVDDLAAVRAQFESAAEPFTRSPWSWFSWGLLLPAVALATRPTLERSGPWVVLIAWLAVIVVGGSIEMLALRSAGSGPRTTLATWVLRSQANLSFVAVALSAVLAWVGQLGVLPGLWLLILGHSFLVMGGLAYAPFRRAGWIYQLGGVAALWPTQDGLVWFALATGLGNLSIAAAVWSAGRRRLAVG